jgi:hypothetical protein
MGQLRSKARRHLTREEEHELAKRIQKGDLIALDALVSANQDWWPAWPGSIRSSVFPWKT